MTIYKPMTPTLRRKILDGISAQIGELSAAGVDQNALVRMEKAQLAVAYRLIENLPDGYPVPIERG